MFNVDTKAIKIGDLLVELGLVSQKDLNEALQIGKDTGLPIGRVLTMSAFISEAQFQAAVQGQSLLKDGIVGMDAVKKAVELVSSQGLTPEEAFTKIGMPRDMEVRSAKLGDLLLAAGFVTPEQVEAALAQSGITGLPLGRLLVLSGILSESLLTSALNAQVLIRDGRVTKDQAIEGLRNVKKRQVPIEAALSEKGFYALPNSPTVRLGELLTQANIVSSSEVMNSIEMGLINDKQLGQVLLEMDRIKEDILSYALELQGQVESEGVTVAEAIEELIRASREGIKKITPAKEAPKPAPTPAAPKESITLVKFLKSMRCINEENITAALQTALRDNAIFAKLLIMGNIVDQITIDRAQEIHGMLENQVVNLERASILFDLCKRKNIGVKEAMEEMSWQQQGATAEPAKAASPAQPTPNPTPEAVDPAPTVAPPVAPTISPSSVTADIPKPTPPPTPVQAATMPSVAPSPRQTSSNMAGIKKPRQTQTTAHVSLWEDARKPAEEAFNRQDWTEANKLWTIALKMAEPLGEIDARYAYSMEKLAESQLNLKLYVTCEPLYLRAHELKLKILGPKHLSIAATLNNLSKLYYFQGKYDQAEPLAREFVDICESSLGEHHPDVACGIHNLATLYHTNSKFELAEQQYKRALEICRKTLGNEHPATVRLLKSYASLLKTLHREAEAVHLDACAQGTITGSWKVISITPEQSLHEEL
jgi:tetratricopeptide (TPR) repeat protein